MQREGRTKSNDAGLCECGFRIAELRDLRCAIWDVRFKTEDTGYRIQDAG